MSKLEDAGWGPELQYLERVRKSYALEHHELVKVAKPLTERSTSPDILSYSS